MYISTQNSNNLQLFDLSFDVSAKSHPKQSRISTILRASRSHTDLFRASEINSLLFSPYGVIPNLFAAERSFHDMEYK
jgi:hypothetical protein